MFFGCKHKWEVKVDRIIETPLAEAIRRGQEMTLEGRASGGKHIVVMICTKCGKVYERITILGI
jgi:hypothetical protein